MKKTLVIFMTFIMVLSMSFTTFASTAESFSDIEGHWAKRQITELTSQGIINGKGNGVFDPNGTVTIAEFIKLAVAVTGATYDVSGYDYWATPYINKAVELGIITQYQFPNYNRPITREEMAYIGYGSFSIINHPMDYSYSVSHAKYNLKDHQFINDQYKKSVYYSYLVGLITGKPGGVFDPKGTATRAEASVVTLRMIEEKERATYVYDFSSIPYTIIIKYFWNPDAEVFNPDDPSSMDGYVEYGIKAFAPMNQYGKVETALIGIRNFVIDGSKDKGNVRFGGSTDYYTASLGGMALTDEAFDKLSIDEKVNAVDFGFSTYFEYFGDENEYPYFLILRNSSDFNYFMDLYKNTINKVSNEMFDNESTAFLNLLETSLNQLNGDYALDKTVVLNNRKIHIGGKNSLEIYISEQYSE